MIFRHQSYHGMMPLRFYLPLYFSVQGVFFRNRLRELGPSLVAWVVAKFEQILWGRFGNILKQSFRVIRTLNKHAIDIIS